VGWFIGFLIGFVLGSIIGEGVIGSGALGRILGNFTLVAVHVSVVSSMQWLVLRRRISRAGWWVLAGTVGCSVAWVVGYGVAVAAGYSETTEGFAAVLGLTLVAALGGAAAGILQWLVLRRRISRAGWWVLASTVGWGLGIAIAATLEEVVAGGSILVAGGPVLGAVTGGALVWLLRQSVPEVQLESELS